MSVTVGTQFGPYRILGPIGAGGMGEVYRARDTRLGRDVAIKILPHSATATSEDRARLKREAKAISALNHPNICILFDVGQEDSTDYLVMELIEGETLARRIARGPLPTAEVLRIGAQIADALDRAHRVGLVHRDIKPGNIMVTKHGAKLMDFGLARSTRADQPANDLTATATESRAASEPITAKGIVLGTFQYMAPEQLEGKATDARSDVWALGCVLYEMATGKRAFEGATAISIISAIMKDQPRRMTELVPITPPALERLVFQCLAKDPEERWQTAGDLKRELLWMGQPDTLTSSQSKLSRRVNRKLMAFGVATLIVALSAFLVLRGRLPTASKQPRFTSLTFKPISIFCAAFAPDGRSVLFSGAEQGTSPQVFIIRPEYPEPQPVTASGVHLLSVSSKGELAVLTNATSRYGQDFWGTLAVMPLGGGAPREIAGGVVGADWYPDGSQLAIIRDIDERDQIEFPLGVARYITGGLIRELRVSPRGDRIAYLEQRLRFDSRADVWIMDRRGTRKQLTFDGKSIKGLAWSRDGSEILFSSDPGSEREYSIHAVRPGGSLRNVMVAPGSLIIQDVSREGNWLVMRDERESSVFVHRPEWNQDRDLSWLDTSIEGYLTNDGESIAFTEWNEVVGRGGTICLRKTDGSPVVKLGTGSAMSISPDGKWVLARVAASRGQRLVLYPTGAGTSRRIDTGDLDNFLRASFFPGGDSILLSGGSADTGMRCYVQSLSGASRRPVTPEGVSRFRLSQDGSSFLARLGPSSYALYDVGSGKSTPVPTLTKLDGVFHWNSESKIALVRIRQDKHSWDDLPLVMEEVDLGTGRRKPFRVSYPRDRPGLQGVTLTDVTPDLRAYAYEASWKRSSLYMVEPATPR